MHVVAHRLFTVPDLADAVRRVRALGLTVTGESYDHVSWREAFIVPERTHGTVLQLAQSELAYPAPAELLATRDRNPDMYPSSQGAGDPWWWEPLWDTGPESQARLGATRLGSTDLDASRRLFRGVLGARLTEEQDGTLRFAWPSGSVLVHRANRPGITGMTLEDGPPAGLRIGSASLTPEARL